MTPTEPGLSAVHPQQAWTSEEGPRLKRERAECSGRPRGFGGPRQGSGWTESAVPPAKLQLLRLFKMLSSLYTQTLLVQGTPPTPQPGLIGPPCAFPHSSHTSPHTAGRRAKAGSSTCRARRARGPGGPTSGHSKGGAGGPPSSHHRSKAPRILPQSPTCSGRAGFLRTTHRSTGAGSAGPGLGHLCSGPARSLKR